MDALRAWAARQSATLAAIPAVDNAPAGETDRVLPCAPSSFDSYLGPHALRQACAAAGVPRFTPYGLRRAAVDAMARAGVDPATAASITGHSVSVMLTAYRTVSEDDRRRAVAAAGLGRLTRPKVLAFPRIGDG